MLLNRVQDHFFSLRFLILALIYFNFSVWTICLIISFSLCFTGYINIKDIRVAGKLRALFSLFVLFDFQLSKFLFSDGSQTELFAVPEPGSSGTSSGRFDWIRQFNPTSSELWNRARRWARTPTSSRTLPTWKPIHWPRSRPNGRRSASWKLSEWSSSAREDRRRSRARSSWQLP